MANSIRNSHNRSVLHIDTTDGAITLAELKASGEATPTKAHIVEIFWQTATSLTIDRGGTAVHAFTGTGHWNLTAAGTVLSGTNTDDIGKIFSKNDVSVIVPNNQLSAEKSLNLEMGLQLKIKTFINLQIQVFQTQITDAIERREATLNGLDSIIYDGEMMRVMMNTNIGSATIKGLNFAYQLNINDHFSHNTIINVIHGKAANSLPLAHIPPTNIISSVKYKYKQQSIDLSTHYNGLKKAEDYDLEGIDNLEEATIIGNPSWCIINLKYQTTIDKNLTFIAGIHNIMDIHYKTFGSGISASGRNFSLTLQSKF